MTVQPRCIWSNERHDDLKEVTVLTRDRFARNPQPRTFYVMPEQEEQFRRFSAFALRYSPLFLILMAALLLAMIVLSVLGSEVAVGVTVVLIGLLFVVFPFSTPETVQMMGLRKSIRLARGLGVLTAALGAWIISLT